MKIVESSIKSYKVTELDSLDPLTIMVEDFGGGRAEVTIKIYGESWTSYWGSMGGSVKDFFTRTNVPYLVNCFDRGIRKTSENVDKSAMKEVFEYKIKSKIKEERYNERVTKDEARLLWNAIDTLDLESIIPEHDHECFNWGMDHWSVDYNAWSKLFYSRDVYDLEEFNQ
tara:strand:- start:30085 stop:30594 length:510 start_codon:yes stop_codon:yes gene_type:complete